MRTPLTVSAAAVVLSALLQTVIFPVAGPLPDWRASLAWFALVPLLWLLLAVGERWRWWQLALAGYANGVLWYLGTCYWVYATMHRYGGLPAPVAVLVMVLFCLYLGLYHGVFALLLWLARRRGTIFALASVPVLWVAVEFARAHVTSFPWNLLGYAEINNALLTKLAPVTGVYGIGFVLAAVNAAIAAALVVPRRRGVTTLALVAALVATGVQNFGVWRTVPLGTQKAVMLQPNLSVGADDPGPRMPDAASMARNFARLTAEASELDSDPARIALWPESPSPFQTDRTEFTEAATALAQHVHAPVIAGAIGVDPDMAAGRRVRITNAAVLFLPDQGKATQYEKIHLVPFGEFVPYAELFRFAGGLTQAVGTFDRGTQRMPLAAQGHRYGTFLCYESIFGDEVRQFVRNGAEVLVNLSDDGWYGDTSAPFQHLNMARMRAIENHRWLLRDTNTGITAAIDPEGRVTERMERHQRGAVAVHFEYLQGMTFYTRFGNVFAWICVLVSLLACGSGAAARKGH